jgi:hypothetical protein
VGRPVPVQYDNPDRAARAARSQLEGGGFGGSNFLVADSRAAFVVHAPGVRRISVVSLEPGTHAMTNYDVDDSTDSRIRLVRSALDPGNFLDSAGQICRDPRVLIRGGDRGTVSSSLILAGGDVALFHISGDPAGREYDEFRLFDSGPASNASSTGRGRWRH